MVKVNKEDIKKMRTLRLFIDATAQIIEQKGIEGVTIREVAKITGYNSATIYNYFDNCNELISFAAMKFISDYVQAIPEYIAEADSPLEKFLAVWQCFCEYCFDDPQLYYAIFTADIGDKPENLIKDYYSLFPDDLGDPPQDLVPMLMESDFSKRCEILIEPCVKTGYFTKEQAEEINELIRLIYQGMLSLMINNRIDYSTEKAVERTMKHIRMVVNERAKVN
ncbi:MULTISPECIES: TetR/AcrR family transcriptional regulator [unclassified Candidatus Frackibacter]|uniref:TetR/AcrR family transcriptional regulator n=1 Tax=unclassified Candidatus Frackibacter TaxID=2648818 RepID=UPI00079BBE57|nr:MULTISPECIES: TetR/AcrR family transcriptional regulator [unclassified Candidatus Frackibacter]KXS41065.1 MAG: TetR family transcriptional regulator [Candidatus Frackibacter sp. T328-2]SDC12904.1 regulatory protein, tetR family [Candidatus Frackibacter sp. WG11]SEM35587.1 regulatory protein, tetR family [Candidatus Frackibacter sp. WG12]SFL40714.1 regulatory protein, tetR family [Candidatus Frackibacter sp. WG13]